MNQQWKTGQRAAGTYCGQPYSGKLARSCRPTPDYKNVIFTIALDAPITVFGQQRERIEIWTNAASNTITLT